MTGIDPISLAVLTKAIDFLFDEAGKIYHEHRMSKKQANPTRESAPETSHSEGAITLKEELTNLNLNPLALQDSAQEIEHCMTLIHQYRHNRRLVETQVAMHGGFIYTPLPLQNQLRNTELEIESWITNLKEIVEEIYGSSLVIPGIK